MKRILVLAVAAVAAAAALAGDAPVTPALAATAGTPSLTVHAQFYSDFEHFTIRWRLGPNPNPACQNPDTPTFSCYEWKDGDARWDVRVWQTWPGPRRLVYADSTDGFHGSDEANLYWTADLHAPLCYGAADFQRGYYALFSLYSPTTDQIIARYWRTFGLTCG